MSNMKLSQEFFGKIKRDRTQANNILIIVLRKENLIFVAKVRTVLPRIIIKKKRIIAIY
jgi:hypothetical protein